MSDNGSNGMKTITTRVELHSSCYMDCEYWNRILEYLYGLVRRVNGTAWRRHSAARNNPRNNKSQIWSLSSQCRTRFSVWNDKTTKSSPNRCQDSTVIVIIDTAVLVQWSLGAINSVAEQSNDSEDSPNRRLKLSPVCNTKAHDLNDDGCLFERAVTAVLSAK